MANQFAAPPINPLISVQPLGTPQAGRDAPDIPSGIANVPNGTTVEGFVVNRDAQNNPILRTPVGDILIKSDFFLKTGSVVVFRVDNTQASRARILTVDGLTPTDYVAQQARVPPTDTIEQSLPSSPAPDETEQAPQKLPTATPPLKAVLVAPASTTSIDIPTAALPTTTTADTATATAKAAALPTDDLPIPRILANLQAGAVLKVTVLRVTLPLVLPTTPAPAGATPTVVPAGTGVVVVDTPAPHTVTPPTIQTPLPPPVANQPVRVPVAPPVTPPIAALNVPSTATFPIPIAPNVTLPPITPAQVQVPAAPVPIPPLPAAMPPQPFAVPAVEAVSIQQVQIPPIPPAAIEQNNAVLQPVIPRPAPATAAFNAYQSATARTPPAANAPIQATPYVPPPTEKADIAPSLTAVVIGHEMDGATILHTRVGTLKTYLPQSLPTGTQLTVRLEPGEPAALGPADTSTLSDSMESITTLARDWKSLAAAVQWLQVSDPTLFNQITQQLPNIGPRFASGLLFFIAAIKGGDVRAWLGNRAVDALERKAPELLARLRADASQLQELASESPGRTWQMSMLPVMVHGQLEQARLFYRQEDNHDEEGKKGGSKQHRFIIEVELSHMGSLQFDGFVRDGKQKRVFDLIIRSARPLAEQVSADIRNLFDNALKTTGYRGYLAFQQGSQHFVRPLAGITSGGDTPQAILA